MLGKDPEKCLPGFAEQRQPAAAAGAAVPAPEHTGQPRPLAAPCCPPDLCLPAGYICLSGLIFMAVGSRV